MGKAVKKVLKVAAFVAIATFAAPVAAGIGLSAAVGTIAGSAVVGAAAGAATNAALGGGVLKGALLGGVGGGIGGALKVASTGTGIFGDAYAAAPSAAPSLGADSLALGGGAGGAAPPGAAAIGPASDIVVNAPTAAASGLSAAAPVVAGLAGAGAGLAAGAPSLGAQQPLDPNDPALARAGAAPITPVGAVADTPVVAAGTTGGVLGSGLGKAGLDVAKVVAPTLLAGAITGSGAQQADLVASQQAALEAQRQQYNNNFNIKTGYAQGLFDTASQYDPEVAGRRAAEAARIRAGLSANNAARGVSSQRAEALRRQGQIEGGRDATRDYWSAYGTTGGQRVGVQAAAISAIPLGNPPGTGDYNSAYDTAGKNTSNVAGLISSGLTALTADNYNDPRKQGAAA